MTKKVVVVYQSEEDLKGTAERRADRRAKIDQMVSEGKTNGVTVFPNPTTAELTFVDQASAEEWVAWGSTNLNKYGITPVSLEIQ
jgi:hypothetical protein